MSNQGVAFQDIIDNASETQAMHYGNIFEYLSPVFENPKKIQEIQKPN